MSSKKILLIAVVNSAFFSNAAIDQIAYYLRGNGKSVDTLYFQKDDSIEDIQSVLSLEYDVFGLSVDYSWLDISFAIANHIKLHALCKTVCFGGSFSTTMYKDILEDCSSVDYIVLGDGEIPFEYLLDNLGKADFKDYSYIASKGNTEEKNPYINESVDWGQVDDYFLNKNNVANIYCMLTKSNCCTGHCSFCCARKSKKIIYKSADSIVEEIIYKHQKHGIETFYFADDDLTDPGDEIAKNRLFELCDKIILQHKKMFFSCYIKSHSFEDTENDISLLKKMREAGFMGMFVGIESGNESDLKLYNKKTTVPENYKIIELLRKCDIMPMIGFINFNPFSTLETLRENFVFLRNIKCLNLASYAFSFLQLYKYTPIYNLLLKKDLLTSKYTYKDTLEYNYENNDVQRMASFLQDNFGNDTRFKNLYEVDEVIYMYKCLSRHHSDIGGIDDSLYAKTEIYFKEIIAYFSKFYIDNDLGYCYKHLELFKNNLLKMEDNFKSLRNKIMKQNIRDRRM